MRFSAGVLAFLFTGSNLFAQIEVPPSSEVYRLITATIKNPIPEGATVSGGWVVDDGVDFAPCSPGSIHIAAKPGEHTIRFIGSWTHLGPPITVKDVNGVEQTFTPYLGGGVVQEQAEFTVVGGAEPDPPQPGPEPPGPDQKYSLMFFLDANKTDRLPEGQRLLLTSLNVRTRLADHGHELLLVVDDGQIRDGVDPKWAPWIRAARGKALPLMAMALSGGGKIETMPLPQDESALYAILGDQL